MKRYFGWILLYVALIAAITLALNRARQATIEGLETPEAGADWQKWKQETRRQAEQQERSAVKSDEPPGLILMRDHFPGILGGTLAIATFLYAFLVITIRGSLRGGGPPYDLESEQKP